MPLRIAARKAPDAVILPVDREAYDAASAQVMAVVRGQPGAVVQVLGWDEAFVGVTTDDPEGFARRIQTAVLTRTKLHCSVGIGDTLVRAKVATGFASCVKAHPGEYATMVREYGERYPCVAEMLGRYRWLRPMLRVFAKRLKVQPPQQQSESQSSQESKPPEIPGGESLRHMIDHLLNATN